MFMFVKVYRYRVQPEKTEEYLSIQEKAGKIYRKHIRYRSLHLRNRSDPGLWLEIHWYPDEETYRESIDKIDADPDIDRLWTEFQAVLDPMDLDISEENFEEVLNEENLGNS
jgi:hypothetical protein